MFKKGLVRSPEHQAKLTLAAQGRVFTEKAKLAKIKALKGKKLTEEHKRKVSESLRGTVFTEERKRKLKEAAMRRYAGCAVEKKCELCGVSMRTTISRLSKGQGKYCSKKCSSNALYKLPKYQKSRERIRQVNIGKKQSPETIKKRSDAMLGKKFPYRPHLNHRGANCVAWKGGVSTLQEFIRASFKYRLWRSDVFQRDDFTCQWCGKRGSHIHADHIVLFSELLYKNKITALEQALRCEELWNINNGRTLCRSCHKIRHSAKYKKLIQEVDN